MRWHCRAQIGEDFAPSHGPCNVHNQDVVARPGRHCNGLPFWSMHSVYFFPDPCAGSWRYTGVQNEICVRASCRPSCQKKHVQSTELVFAIVCLRPVWLYVRNCNKQFLLRLTILAGVVFEIRIYMYLQSFPNHSNFGFEYNGNYNHAIAITSC